MTVDVAAAERIPGWMTRAELEWLAEAAEGCTRIVEIGCWKGRATKALALHTPGVVYAVDPWEGCPEMCADVAAWDGDGLHQEFVANLRPELNAGKVVVVRARSDEAVHLLRRLLDGQRVDMVFIDGDHSYSSVKRDIENYRLLLGDGGLLAGHDYSTVWPGVAHAVDELVSSRSVVADGSIWYARLPEAALTHAGARAKPMLDLEQLAIRRLVRLGDQLRREGRLDDARRPFEQLRSMAPTHVKAERMLASLDGRTPSLPPEPGALDPTPFVRLPEFLPRPLHDRLLESLFAGVDRFEPAHLGRLEEGGVEHREVDRSYRRSAFLMDCFRCVDADLGRAFHERLAGSFPLITSRLQIPLVACLPSPMRALMYRDGDFFRPHRDTGANSGRRITLLYYLYTSPQRFTGGELILYDTFVARDSPQLAAPDFRLSAYTRLPCRDNELVCFPSEYYHEAVAVAGVGDEVRGARIAINGWLLDDETPAAENRVVRAQS